MFACLHCSSIVVVLGINKSHCLTMLALAARIPMYPRAGSYGSKSCEDADTCKYRCSVSQLGNPNRASSAARETFYCHQTSFWWERQLFTIEAARSSCPANMGVFGNECCNHGMNYPKEENTMFQFGSGKHVYHERCILIFFRLTWQPR